MSIKMSRLNEIVNEEVKLFLKEQGSLYGRGVIAAQRRNKDKEEVKIRKLKKRLKELEAMNASSHAKNPLKRKLKAAEKRHHELHKEITRLVKDEKEARKKGIYNSLTTYLTRKQAAEREKERTKGATGAGFPTSGWTGTGQNWVTTKATTDDGKFGTGSGKDWKPKGATGCPKGYYWDAGLGSCEKDLVSGVPTKKRGGKKSRKSRRRAARRSRAALNRTFKKGVMPKGTGFGTFKEYYAALNKAGIKIKKDSHWGPQHYRKWKQLRGAMKGKGGLEGGVEMSAAAAKMARTGKGGPAAGMSANMAQSRDARMASLAISQGRAARMVKNAEKLGLSPAQVAKYKKQLAGVEKQMKGVEAETGVDDSKELAQMSKDVRTQANIDFSTDPKRAAAAQARLDKAADLDPLNPNSKVAKAKRAAAAKAATSAAAKNIAQIRKALKDPKQQSIRDILLKKLRKLDPNAPELKG